MNKTATIISQGCLKELYLQKQTTRSSLVLQILAYQISEFNPKEIMLRISDRQSFVDCLLVGPYKISESKIVSTEYNQFNQSFKKYDFVRIADYFCKIDPSKICSLRIIVRKLEEGTHFSEILGKPEEISQFIENSQLKSKPALFDNTKLNKFGTEETPIKLEELGEEPIYFQPENQDRSNRNASFNQQSPATLPNPMRMQKQDESITLADIMNNKQGYFVGRLVRMKFGCKQAKDGPMSFLYLGLVDTNGDIVRINIAGRMAIKESKELKKGRCYFIRGLELYQGEKVRGGPQIRLKDKEYKICEIQNEAVKSQYKHEYYRWQHENQWTESDLVDVIGVIEDIQEKITYKNTSTFQEQRDVVRLIIRNAFKTVKISLWADHIQIIQNLQLQRKQPILLEDIKKKKTYFLDYISESNIILLDDQPELKEKFAALMPPFQEAPNPTSIKELISVCEMQPYNTKLRVIPARIQSINPKWIIYKMCNSCKKKMEKILETCLECQQSDFIYKYNCAIELVDPSGTINCIAFDPVCQKLFKRSANDFSLLSETEAKQICDSLSADEYLVGIEYKNNRQILRSIQKSLIEQSQFVQTQQMLKFQAKNDIYNEQ